MAEGTAAEFGGILKARREELGLSLSEVCERTRIHVRHLQAIESGAFEMLPGRVYARAFVKHYARVLKMDVDEVAVGFDQAVAAYARDESGGKRRVRSPRRSRPKGQRMIWQWLGVVLFLTLLGGLIAAALNSGTDGASSGGWAPGISNLDVPALPRVIETAPLRAPVDPVVEQVVEPGVEPVEDERVAEPVPADVVHPSSSSDDGNQAPAGASEQAVQAQVPISFVAAPPLEAVRDVAPFPVVLEVDVLRTCWFEVHADGALVFSGALEPGENARWAAEERLVVRYGRPEGVRITLNGQYLGAPGSGVITRVYTAQGVEAL